jgi:hypothetical protein
VGGAGGQESFNATFPAVSGGSGGAAFASAFGLNQGDETVGVTASATGGRGGSAGGAGAVAGSGAAAEARATGISTGGGNVTVTAIQTGGAGGSGHHGAAGGGGAASILEDAVDGSTAGLLRLVQKAIGGMGNSSLGDGGSAVSRLNATNPGGGNLRVDLEATGGEVVNAAGGAGVAGSAHVAADAEGERSVTIEAVATGGLGLTAVSGSTGADGGTATLGSLFGRSLGGESVSVKGTAKGGKGGDSFSLGVPGAGASVLVENAVNGETSGSLRLDQIAVGGDAGSRSSPTATSAGAGDAESRLTRSVSVGSVLARTEAAGGRAAGASPGGSARAQVEVANDMGSASAISLARGGSGGDLSHGEAGTGGHAVARAEATTTGDGHAVSVGSARAGESGALGGAGGKIDGSPLLPTDHGGDGGEASSESVGTALGDSDVVVIDRAVGGAGQRVGIPPAGTGGDGGDASSSAEGSNQGARSVNVSASAEGGAGS